MSYRLQPKDFSTKAIHVGQDPDQWSHQPIIPPIVTSTIYKLPPLGESSEYSYTRCGNPTRDIVAKCLASLDNGKHCLLYSSATAATTSIIQSLSTGDHIIVCREVYCSVKTVFTAATARVGIDVEYIDTGNLDEIKNAIRKNTRLVWLESPSNPCMKLYDIMAISKLVHSYENILVAIDNSMMTPYFQRPLELGVDIVVYAVGKYIGGHSDVLMGSIVLNDDKLYERLLHLNKYSGATPSSFDCYLINRSIKTLSMRMEKHSKSALTVATFLESHARVKRVYYTGLPSHPQYDLMLKQTHGSSGLLSFCIDGGFNEAKKFLQSLKLIKCAESFGGFESLASHTATISKNQLTEEERSALGITQSLIRLSIGLEDVEHIVSDLEQAFETTFE